MKYFQGIIVFWNRFSNHFSFKRNDIYSVSEIRFFQKYYQVMTHNLKSFGLPTDTSLSTHINSHFEIETKFHISKSVCSRTFFNYTHLEVEDTVRKERHRSRRILPKGARRIREGLWNVAAFLSTDRRKKACKFSLTPTSDWYTAGGILMIHKGQLLWVVLM